jgi:hypothetical protein
MNQSVDTSPLQNQTDCSMSPWGRKPQSSLAMFVLYRTARQGETTVRKYTWFAILLRCSLLQPQNPKYMSSTVDAFSGQSRPKTKPVRLI